MKRIFKELKTTEYLEGVCEESKVRCMRQVWVGKVDTGKQGKTRRKA